MINKKPDYYLYKYLERILEFEKELIRSFKLGGIPYNEQNKFPKSGVMIVEGKEITYQFHGNGCTFIEGGVEIVYNIYPDRENYITTAPFEFMQFINTFLNADSENAIAQLDASQYLQELSLKGSVKKIFEDYLVYEIDLEWYKNMNPFS